MSDKIKKLSQAIRLGATFRGQCTAMPFSEGKSCALGAAYEAVFGVANDLVSTGAVIRRLKKRFSLLENYDFSNIYQMNDCLHMTREEIADRLEAEGL